MRIVIPNHVRGQDEDLQLLLTSIALYAPEIEVRVYYTGHSHPVGYLNWSNYYFIRQQYDNKHFGDACRQIVNDNQEVDVLLFVNDDCVFTPHTLPLLEQDIRIITDAKHQMGLVGLRSNFVAGYQNIRRRFENDPPQLESLGWPSETQIAIVSQVFGVAFAVTTNALRDVSDDWTKIHWYGDNLLSYDLKKKGYTHFVSRSYIHHHGSRSGIDYSKYDREAREWLKRNRQDFYATL